MLKKVRFFSRCAKDSHLARRGWKCPPVGETRPHWNASGKGSRRSGWKTGAGHKITFPTRHELRMMSRPCCLSCQLREICSQLIEYRQRCKYAQSPRMVIAEIRKFYALDETNSSLMKFALWPVLIIQYYVPLLDLGKFSKSLTRRPAFNISPLVTVRCINLVHRLKGRSLSSRGGDESEHLP